MRDDSVGVRRSRRATSPRYDTDGPGSCEARITGSLTALEAAPPVESELGVLVPGFDEPHRMWESGIELGLQPGLHLAVVDALPRLAGLPDEDERDPSRPGIVEPDLLRKERDALESGEQGLAEGPHLVVDGEELLHVGGFHLEDEHLDR